MVKSKKTTTYLKGIKKGKTSRYKRTYRKLAKKVPRPVKAYVQHAIARNVETKSMIPYTVSNYAISPYGIAPNGPHQLTTFDLLTPLDGLIQGTNNGQRLGDIIRIKKMSVRGYVNLDSSRADDPLYLKNPMYVKLFVGRRKDTIANPNTTTITGISQAYDNFFMNGPTAASPQNLPVDMYRMVNRDVYKILATRFFKIGNAAPSNDPSTSAQYNNDFSFARHFSIDLSKFIKTVRYNPGTTTTSSNNAIYMWFIVCFANGATVNAVNANLPLECHFDVNAVYEDA